MKQPKNQYQLILWYLYNLKSFSLKDLINDCMFFKAQTKLSELESKHGYLANRKRVKFTNRFGHDSSYNIYSCIDKEKVLKIYNEY